jgi:hypothetical protein
LEAIRLGARRMTSRETLQRFAERLTPATDCPEPATPRGAPGTRWHALHLIAVLTPLRVLNNKNSKQGKRRNY